MGTHPKSILKDGKEARVEFDAISISEKTEFGKTEAEKTEAEKTGAEKTGAEKIIEFTRQNNLSPNDLSLALCMLLAKTNDKTNVEQQIVEEFNKEIQTTQEKN